MSFIKQLLFLTLFILFETQLFCLNPVLPPFDDTDLWFGPPNGSVSTAINPFSINISDAVLQDLHYRLQNARFVAPLPNTEFNYGFNLDFLRQVVVPYWKNTFNWRAQEQFLNQFPQYKTQIYGLDIHFIHIKPSKPANTTIPLIMNHGWPQSFFDFTHVIPLLIAPGNGLAFEIVVPSIPGHGFSDPPQAEGFNSITCAATYVKLMNRLGFDKFFIHGGDWGAAIGISMTQYFTDSIRGLHLLAGALDFTAPATDPYVANGQGYRLQQSTKPDTIGQLLIDSPVGLAGWILEKLSDWSGQSNINKTDGGLLDSFSLDTMLTEIMIYWVSNNAASGVRFYKENTLGGFFGTQLYDTPTPEEVPVGLINFPADFLKPNKTVCDSLFPNLIHNTTAPKGGHFGALEVPVILATDIRSFIQKVLDTES